MGGWVAVACCAAMMLGGCGGTAWEFDYVRARTRASAASKPMLIYFRDWMNPECSRMETDVLAQPECRQMLEQMVVVLLDVRLFEDVAERYGIAQTPAYVVTTPDGRAVARGEGVPALDEFVGWLGQAVRRADRGSRAGISPVRAR